MKKNILLLFVIFFSINQVQSQTVEIGSTLEDVNLINASSNQPANLYAQKGNVGLVVIFTSTNCPFVKIYENRINQLAQQYQSKGISFIFVNSSNPQTSPENNSGGIANYLKTRGQGAPYFIDNNATLANKLNATKTPEVFLFKTNGSGLVLKYRGAIDDNPQVPNDVTTNYLKEAMDGIISNSGVRITEKKTTGCMIQK